MHSDARIKKMSHGLTLKLVILHVFPPKTYMYNHAPKAIQVSYPFYAVLETSAYIFFLFIYISDTSLKNVLKSNHRHVTTQNFKIHLHVLMSPKHRLLGLDKQK